MRQISSLLDRFFAKQSITAPNELTALHFISNDPEYEDVSWTQICVNTQLAFDLMLRPYA